MRKMKKRSQLCIPGAGIAILALSGCSGDGRALEEAIEAHNLKLDRLAIELPNPYILDTTTTLPTLHANPSQRVPFEFVATDDAGLTIELPDTDRRWISSNPGVATIDGSGMLSTVNNGNTLITLQIGGIVSNVVQVGVQNAVISSIISVEGETDIDQCIAGNYFATARFTDDTVRGLSNVDWRVSNEDSARVAKLPSGEVELVGLQPGVVQLMAVSGSQQLDWPITVSSSLESILINPSTTSLEVGQSTFLSAIGVYSTATETRRAGITGTVTWSLEDGTPSASLTTSTSGRVTLNALSTGGTFVTATCGNIAEQQTVGVVEEGTISDNLSFSEENPLVMSVADGALALKLSTGSSYDDDNDVTDEADWEIRGANDGIISLNTTSARGTITPLKPGAVTVRASYSGVFDEITVEVR